VTTAVLSLGSNLGDRLSHLQAALDALSARLPVVVVSSVYETTPVGGPPQPDFLDAVVAVDVPAGTDLLGVLRGVEAKGARTRGERWGPRTIDVDVIACGSTPSTDPTLTLPHPRAAERAFVLLPWLEIDPDAELPSSGHIADLVGRLDTTGVRRRVDLRLRLPTAR